jgi:hypothetical protein
MDSSQSSIAASASPIAGAMGRHIIRPEFGQQFLERPDEGGLVPRTPQFTAARAPVAAGHLPKARPGEGTCRVRGRKAGAGVALALERPHRIGAGFDSAADHSREVHAQKREARIRYGIDQVADESCFLGFEPVVLAAERHDANRRRHTAQSRHTIGLQPGAVDQPFGLDRSGGGLEDKTSALAPKPDESRRGSDRPTAFAHFSGDRLRDPPVVDDPGLRNEKPLDTSNVRFVFAELVRR